MSQFRNSPQVQNQDGQNTVKRYVHSPLTIEHNGIQAAIQKNGRIKLTKVANVIGEEVEFDEVEIPASLVFKLGSLLRATRKVEFVAIQEAAQYEDKE